MGAIYVKMDGSVFEEKWSLAHHQNVASLSLF